MIVCAPLGRAPAIGWQRDNDVPVDTDAKPKLAVQDIRIVGRVAPGVVNARCHLRGESGQESGIIGERERCGAFTCSTAPSLLPSPLWGGGGGGGRAAWHISAITCRSSTPPRP